MTAPTPTPPRSGARRRALTGAVLVIGVLALSACAAGPNPALDSGPDPAGFWLGLWHGFISLFTFVISLFSDTVSVYEVHNNGGWYDFGFIVGVSAFFGGGGGGSARRRR